MKTISNLFLLLITSLLLCQADVDDYLNSKVFLKSLEPLRTTFQEKGIVLLDENSKYRGYATLMNEEGYAFAKLSEINSIENQKEISARVDQTNFQIKRIKEFIDWDLVLIRLIDCPVEPIPFANKVSETGSLILSHSATSLQKRRIKMGVISAQQRKTRDSGLMLPFLFSIKEDRLFLDKLFLEELKDYKGWQLLEISGQKVDSLESFEKLTEEKELAQQVEVLIGNKGERKRLKLSYDWRANYLFGPVNGNEAMSGRMSARRTGFPEIIQHDIPLSARSMGGALLNLEGEVVGMNIARFSRAETYAIPIAQLQRLFEEFLQEREQERE